MCLYYFAQAQRIFYGICIRALVVRTLHMYFVKVLLLFCSRTDDFPWSSYPVYYGAGGIATVSFVLWFLN